MMSREGVQRGSPVACWVSCLATDARDPTRTADDLAALSPDERGRHDRLMFGEDRRDFAAAHALLRSALSHVAGCPATVWQFTAAPPHHKPRLAPGSYAGPPLSFNLSHSRGLVACAITTGAEVGIDVERADRVRDIADLAARFFSADETRQLERTAPDARARTFTELWTLKEAFLKCVGIGLAMPLSAMSFDLREPGALHFIPPPDLSGGVWHYAVYLPTPEHVMAVALCDTDRARPAAPPQQWCEARWGDGLNSSPLVPFRVSK